MALMKLSMFRKPQLRFLTIRMRLFKASARALLMLRMSFKDSIRRSPEQYPR